MPEIDVPASEVVLTVLNGIRSVPPGVPSSSASSSRPLASLISEPLTTNSTSVPPGIGSVEKSQAKVRSSAGTILAGSFLPAKAR